SVSDRQRAARVADRGYRGTCAPRHRRAFLPRAPAAARAAREADLLESGTRARGDPHRARAAAEAPALTAVSTALLRFPAAASEGPRLPPGARSAPGLQELREPASRITRPKVSLVPACTSASADAIHCASSRLSRR